MVTLLQQQATLAIEEKRNELYDINKRYGFLHYNTIQCSQELDQLINQLFKKYTGLKDERYEYLMN
ncbi:aspartyl-phosphate phosphatase Spo0E family protein [Gottfriedia acidiceleris]|uniref:aspartyl-phosphate phosphatase Spo0E family protein n=1 Tax=Bacillaceae TaxID=186817 RepID=UPI000BF5C437|nr:aspartyl-phosphate phosphatase Spo0E family protein [Bacillus sp. AFS001701]PET77339.1 Spo0E family sporulation regulatory protein-aspartic acid phosphatase [Bacillus sp. AFS001701]